jgi:heat shock transcription factor
MPPTNPRKRAAPGASPATQAAAMPQSYTAPSQVSNAEFLQWSQGPDNTTYPDPATFNLNSYTGNGITQAPYDQSVPATSTQLARRPINRQLVPTGQRAGYDNLGDPWGQFGDNSILDSKNPGAMEETDSIEALEEKATAAKREAQAKRKQIPPFVQKLSR